MNKIYHYYVEGECEEKFINALKAPGVGLLLPGKVDVFNVINEVLANQRLLVLKPNTIIILVYDVDVNNSLNLDKNISFLRKNGFSRIYHIQSIRNFEEELVFSTNIKNINEMFNTECVDEFKKIFLQRNNIVAKLNNVKYDNDKMWSRVNNIAPFDNYSNKQSLNLIKKSK